MKSLIFIQNKYINSLLLKVVGEELLDVSSTLIGEYLSEQIDKVLHDINKTNEFISLTHLVNRYVVLLMLRQANNNSSSSIVNDIDPNIVGEQIIRKEIYVSYMYNSGVWEYLSRYRSSPSLGIVADLKLSTDINTNHNKLCKILSLVYPTKMPIKPYIIPPTMYDEAMTPLVRYALSDYKGLDRTDTSIMKSLVESYERMRGIDPSLKDKLAKELIK